MVSTIRSCSFQLALKSIADGTRWVVRPALEFISAVIKQVTKPASEFAIHATPDVNGFIREEGAEREHLGWRVLKDGEVVIADADAPGLVAGL